MKKNNKGFSLVELIIVIAIMAVLVAVLAPQYIKYVEKSRVAADQTQIDEIVKAVKVATADPECTAKVPFTVTIAINGTGTATIETTADTIGTTTGEVGDMNDLLKTALGTLNPEFKSSKRFSQNIKISVGTDYTFTVDD